MAYTCESCESGFGYAILLLREDTADSESFRGAFWGIEATHSGLDYSGVEITSALYDKPEMAFSDEVRAQQYKDFSNIPINLKRYGLKYGDIYAGSWTDANGKMLLVHTGALLGGGPAYNAVLGAYGYVEDFLIEPIFGVEPLGDLIQGSYPVIRPRSQWGWQYYSTFAFSPPGGL